jgi:hypothetical protein
MGILGMQGRKDFLYVPFIALVYSDLVVARVHSGEACR